MQYYPNNTVAHYFTKLSKDVSLDGDWEVGLSEIVFQRSWFNVLSPQVISIIHKNTTFESRNEQTVMIESAVPKNIVVEQGYYPSVKVLVDEINSEIDRMYKSDDDLSKKRRPVFSYSTHTRKTSVRLTAKSSVYIPTLLGNIMGFTESTIVNIAAHGKRFFKGMNASDIDYGMHALYVYCDVLEHTPVGDTLAPLLRIVEVDGEHGNTIHRNYDNPRYVPVQKRNFSSLEIDIRTNAGEAVPFERGPSVVILHFRQAKRPYLV